MLIKLTILNYDIRQPKPITVQSLYNAIFGVHRNGPYYKRFCVVKEPSYKRISHFLIIPLLNIWEPLHESVISISML